MTSSNFRGNPLRLRPVFLALAAFALVAHADNFETLTAGLTEVGAGHSPGQLLPFDSGWKGILGGDDDSSTHAAIVLARQFEGDRVMAVAENGFFICPTRTDNYRLMDNSVDC